MSTFVSACLYAAVGFRLCAQHNQLVDLLSRHRSSTSGGFIGNRSIETLAAVAGLVVAIWAVRICRDGVRAFVVGADLAAVAISVLGLQLTPSRFLPSTVNASVVAQQQQQLGEGAVLLFVAASSALAASAVVTMNLRRRAVEAKAHRGRRALAPDG